jgi:hypothetical protein
MMNAAQSQYSESNSFPCFAHVELLTEAEKEFTAFLFAVTEVHGPQCVSNAAEHWIQALNAASLPYPASKECFRSVTFSAVVSLCN